MGLAHFRHVRVKVDHCHLFHRSPFQDLAEGGILASFQDQAISRLPLHHTGGVYRGLAVKIFVFL
jgi:hypothetical protein